MTRKQQAYQELMQERQAERRQLWMEVLLIVTSHQDPSPYSQPECTPTQYADQMLAEFDRRFPLPQSEE